MLGVLPLSATLGYASQLRLPQELAEPGRAAAVPPPPVFFLHLHKSGGTSFVTTAAERGLYNDNDQGIIGRDESELDTFPANALSKCSGLKNERCCLRRDTARHRGMTVCEPGHNVEFGPNACAKGFDPEVELCGGDLRYITLIRDPMQRLLSHMCQHDLVPADVSSALSPATEMQATRTILTDADTTKWPAGPGLDNYYVRALAGPSAWSLPAGALNETHFATAQRTLQAFDVIMRLERLPDDLQQMAQLSPSLRWPNLLDSEVNACPDRGPPLSEFTRPGSWQSVVDANRLDRRLYAWADQMVEARMRKRRERTRVESREDRPSKASA